MLEKKKKRESCSDYSRFFFFFDYSIADPLLAVVYEMTNCMHIDLIYQQLIKCTFFFIFPSFSSFRSILCLSVLGGGGGGDIYI